MAQANGQEKHDVPMDLSICGSGGAINGPHHGKPMNQIKEGTYRKSHHGVHEPKAGSHMRNTKYSATSHMKG